MNDSNDPIASIRIDYKLKSLSEEDTAANAFEQFARWWSEARNSHLHEVNAMTLATADKDGNPSARIVLLKGYDERGFIFFTNYKSAKGNELAANPKASLLFFWKELERQIRIDGIVEKVSAAESDVYYKSRPAGSRIGAWASPQSSVIENRKVIVSKYAEGLWVNFLFVYSFWLKDESNAFEKTDEAIERSINLAIDLMGKSALDSALDFGKFLFQNR